MTTASTGAAPLHVLLLAGGGGTRFWPLSRAGLPKPFLRLDGKRTLLEGAWRRARRLVPADRIWVAAPRPLRAQLRAALPELGKGRLVLEPDPRDTAPALGLACAHIARLRPDAVVAVFPTDHVVRDGAALSRAVRAALPAARGGRLVCLGVEPRGPSSRFGYLRCAERPSPGTVVRVERFVEKPDAARARRMLATGRYLWNSGMFVWSATRFLDELRRASPRTWSAVRDAVAGRAGAWGRAVRGSVDRVVLETAADVAVVPLDAGWDDVGTWDAAQRLMEGRRSSGSHVAIASPGSFVFDDVGVTAIVGVPGVVVVRTADAVLVVSRERAEEVRRVPAALRAAGLGRFA